MPTRSAVPPSDRFFARLEKFQCACPSCGRLVEIHSRVDAEGVRDDRQTGMVRARRHEPRPSQRTWNPVTQRLRCPSCRVAFVAGLLLYPLKGYKAIEPPPDVVKTRAERMEQRRIAGGWCSEANYREGDPVNVFVSAPCRCPPRGWASDCPLHGTPAPMP